jgi:MFS family permease
VVFGIGAIAGIGLRSLSGGGDAAVRYVLLAAAVTYVVAGLVPLSLGRDQLGPTGDRPGETVADVARGLLAGCRVLAGDRPSWESVAASLVHRIAFGSLTVLLLLILRNTINPASRPEAALRDFTFIATAVTIGALLAAVLTPTMTRRMGTVNWTCLTLVLAAVVAPIALIPVNVWAMTAGGAVIGLSQQCAKIGADTTLQRRIADDHLGRVFSLFDVGVNVCLVLGALLVALTAPLSGVSLPGFFALSVLYAATAIWYRRTVPDSIGGNTRLTG